MKVLLVVLILSISLSAQKEASIAWRKVHRGANFFNKVPTAERFKAAKRAGFKFIRLAPNKWKSKAKDFLIGDIDYYKGLVKEDLAKLLVVLNLADSLGIKIVITMLSLPGSRWKQHNNNKLDKRIWKDFKYHREAARFWKDLALELRYHSAVIGYDLLNEPVPERAAGFKDWVSGNYDVWYNKIVNSPADLNIFYARIINEIRSVDKTTAIILETGFWATPWAISYLKPSLSNYIIYSFHMYEPYEYTNFRQKKYSYPGKIPLGEGEKKVSKMWDRAELEAFFKPIAAWQKKYKIAPKQIYVGEFGVYRKHAGAKEYLEDLIFIFNTNSWHWSYYSFREDTWDGMDYELGSKPLGAKYWEEFEKGKKPSKPWRRNPIYNVIRKGLYN